MRGTTTYVLCRYTSSVWEKNYEGQYSTRVCLGSIAGGVAARLQQRECEVERWQRSWQRKDQARLEIKGSPGTEFIGSCTVGDGEPAKIGGEAPRRFSCDLEERALECEVNSDDSLRVELAVGENTHSAQSISGGTLPFIYENGNVSTSTSSSGSHGAGAASSSHVSSYAGANANGHGDNTHGPLTKESRNVSGFDGSS